MDCQNLWREWAWIRSNQLRKRVSMLRDLQSQTSPQIKQILSFRSQKQERPTEDPRQFLAMEEERGLRQTWLVWKIYFSKVKTFKAIMVNRRKVNLRQAQLELGEFNYPLAIFRRIHSSFKSTTSLSSCLSQTFPSSWTTRSKVAMVDTKGLIDESALRIQTSLLTKQETHHQLTRQLLSQR